MPETPVSKFQQFHGRMADDISVGIIIWLELDWSTKVISDFIQLLGK
jgi:hypothetical protein